MHTTTLVMLSGGGHTGHNVVGALSGRHQGLRLVACSDIADEPTLFAYDIVHIVPTLSRDPANFESAIIDVLERYQPDLIIPCRDEDVVWTARFANREQGRRWTFLCGAPAIAEMAYDKWLSYVFCRRHDLPFAATFLCGADDERLGTIDDFVRAHGLPLVMKPRHGAEGRGIRIVIGLDQARRAASRSGFVLQQYLGEPGATERYLRETAEDGIPLFHSFEGIKRSLQILIGPSGGLLGVYCTLHATTARNARSIAPDSDDDAMTIALRCADVLMAQGWHGPMNIQCQRDAAGNLLIHEFNARFTGATEARRLLGHDEVGIALAGFTKWVCENSTMPNVPVVREGLAPRAAPRIHVEALTEHKAWQSNA